MQAKINVVSSQIKNEKGFKYFLIATHFLWAYPKNAEILPRLFGVCVPKVHGKDFWIWLKRIAELGKIKLVWRHDVYNDPNSQIIIVSVDGKDCSTWETQHPTLPIDKGVYSHKYKHAALKYKIAIDAVESKVVRISGPWRGGESDKNIFIKVGLGALIPVGKKASTDRVYADANDKEHNAKLSYPNPSDDIKTAKLKSHIRCRHETFNGRMAKFGSISQMVYHLNKIMSMCLKA